MHRDRGDEIRAKKQLIWALTDAYVPFRVDLGTIYILADEGEVAILDPEFGMRAAVEYIADRKEEE